MNQEADVTRDDKYDKNEIVDLRSTDSHDIQEGWSKVSGFIQSHFFRLFIVLKNLGG